MSSENFHVFAISETDLEHYDEKNPFSFPGYTTYRGAQIPGQKYTRLLCFVSEELQCKERPDLMEGLSGTVFLEITPQQNKPVLLCTTYRQFDIPGSKKKEDSKTYVAQKARLVSFGQQLSKACQENKKIFVMGDFNLDLQKKEDRKYYLHNLMREYLSFQGENGLVFLRMGITFSRIKENGTVVESELDHLLTNCPDEVTEYGTRDSHRVLMI